MAKAETRLVFFFFLSFRVLGCITCNLSKEKKNDFVT